MSVSTWNYSVKGYRKRKFDSINVILVIVEL